MNEMEVTEGDHCNAASPAGRDGQDDFRDKIFVGVVESITDDVGMISFPFKLQLKQVSFSRDNVVVDNVKLTRKISLKNIFRIGMQVIFSVEHVKQKVGDNFKVAVVEVDEPINLPNCSAEELKHVHNKVFYGKIESLQGFSGTIAFDIDSRTELAAFSKDCVYISGEKLKVIASNLDVGQHVCLKVVCYSGVSGCNYLATVVKTVNDLDVNCTSEPEINDHITLYGTVNNVTDISGSVTFIDDGEEKKVTFYRSSVIVNKLKLMKNIPVSTVLKDGMNISFVIENKFFSKVVKLVEVLQEECSNSSTYSGLFGTITTLRALAGTVSFYINKEKKTAVFFRRSVISVNENKNKYTSLTSALREGSNVSLDVITYEEKSSDFMATAVCILNSEDFSQCPVPDTFHVLSGEVFDGILQEISDTHGIVKFCINGKEERAIFFRQNVVVNNNGLLEDQCLPHVLHVSMSVLLKVIPCTEPEFNFFAVSVQVTKYEGTLKKLSDSQGTIIFNVNKVEEKAIMDRNHLYINGKKVYEKKSLLSLLDVGITVAFFAEHLDGSEDYKYIVTHLEVSNLKQSFHGKDFFGIIEKVTNVGGVISFQIQGQTQEAIFCQESVHIIGFKVDSEMSVSAVLEVGLPVTFRMGNTRVDKYFEAAAVVVEIVSKGSLRSSNVATSTQTSKDGKVKQSLIPDQIPFECYSSVKELNKIHGVASFQIADNEEEVVFFKSSVRICGMKLKPSISLTDVLETGMQILMTVEKLKVKLKVENKELDYKADLVHIESTPKCFSVDKNPLSATGVLFQGTIFKIWGTCGIITFGGKKMKENAIFFRESVIMNNKKLDKNVSLLSVLKLGMNISLKVTGCVELNGCSFVATAVEIGDPNPLTNALSIKGSGMLGFIVALEETSGAVVFWKKDKQEKAIFYKSYVRINEEKVQPRVHLDSVLQVGMCVLLQVQKYKDQNFSYKATCISVKDSIKGLANTTKVSTSKHILCGIGIIDEIVSASSAQLMFQLDGLHRARFTLAEFFVDGKKCNDSKALSSYISKGDIYFFNATRRKEPDGEKYLITCVWHGVKPDLASLLEPYKSLISNHQLVPTTAEGTVIALFPPKVAVVIASVWGAMLLFTSSIHDQNGAVKVTEDVWIQDYLSLGDVLILDLSKASKSPTCFPLVKSAWKAGSGKLSKEKSNIQNSCASVSMSKPSPCYSVEKHKDNPVPSTFTSTPVNERGDQLFIGTIVGLGPCDGTLKIVRDNKEEIIYFTKNLVHINKRQLSSDLPLSSILNVGMRAMLRMSFSKENDYFALKPVLVEVTEIPHADNKFFQGTIESFSNPSGVILFKLDDKLERAVFQFKNMMVNETKRQVFALLLEDGMSVSLMVKRIKNSGHCKYEATVVKLELPGAFLETYGLEITPGMKLDVPKNREIKGVIDCLTAISGKIGFKLRGKERKAIFFKNAVYLENTQKVPGKVSLLEVLKPGMKVVFTVRMFEGIFKAKRVSPFEPSSDTDTQSSSEQEISKPSVPKPPPSSGQAEQGISKTSVPKPSAEQEITVMEGKIREYVSSSSVGIIECCIDGKKYEAWFTQDIIIGEDDHKSYLAGDTVKFEGKLELFMDNLKLRIFSIWHNLVSSKLQKKFRKFCRTLCSGNEYTGTVVEKLKADTFIVAIMNVPIFVSKMHVTEPAKFSSKFSSIRLGDFVQVVIQRKYSKKAKCDWYAINAWRSGCTVDVTVEQQQKKGNLFKSVIREGKLVTVNYNRGVLLDIINQIHFQSANAYLFGVSLTDVDLTKIFKPGDVLSYSFTEGSIVPKVWYGPQEFKDNYLNFVELMNFCTVRSIDGYIFKLLAKRLENEKSCTELDAVNRESKETLVSSPKDKSLNEIQTQPSQKEKVKDIREELLVIASCDDPKRNVLNSSDKQKTLPGGKLLEDNEDISAARKKYQSIVLNSTSNLELRPDHQNLASGTSDFKESVKPERASGDRSQFRSPSPILTEIAPKCLHSHQIKGSICEDDILTAVSCSDYTCGYVSSEMVRNSENETVQIVDVDSNSDIPSSSSEEVLKGNAHGISSSEDVRCEPKETDVKVKYVDQETQTLSTGPVLFSKVFTQ